MTKTVAITAIVLIAVVMGISTIAPALQQAFASADDTICVGSISGTHDNVVVPSGSVCTFSSTTINGDLKVESAASLFASSSTINGNIEADGANFILLVSVTVGGDVQIEKSSGGFVNINDLSVGGSVGGDLKITEKSSGSFVQVAGSSIGGDLEMEENSGSFVRAFGNTVDGDLEFNKNTTTDTFAPMVVATNTVTGDLKCKDNSPAPNRSGLGANIVTGDKEGQCAGL